MVGSGFAHPRACYSFCYSPKRLTRLNSPGANLNSRFMAGPQGKTQDVFCKKAAPNNLPGKPPGEPQLSTLPTRRLGQPSGLANLNYKPHPCGLPYGPHCVRLNSILSSLVAIHGELPLPKSKAEAGCKGGLKALFISCYRMRHSVL